ncbi:MAG: hypothetical protein EXS05_03345 [Planctomycetaceae bacterium]|nr:hypothetical protein [Planctomycetaceae bacterium]
MNSELTALKVQGLPTTGSEINDFYFVPRDVADTTDLWVSAIDAVQAAKLWGRTGSLLFAETVTKTIPDPGESWVELDEVRNRLGELASEMQAIRRAAAAGGQVRFPVDFSPGIHALLTHTQHSRKLARLLSLDAFVSA